LQEELRRALWNIIKPNYKCPKHFKKIKVPTYKKCIIKYIVDLKPHQYMYGVKLKIKF